MTAVRIFDTRRGAILVQYPGALGRRRCANRREAGEELHFRRQCRRWDAEYGAEPRVQRYDRILRDRAHRLLSAGPMWDRSYFPFSSRLPCPCCGASSGGKYRLTETGRKRLHSLRAQQNARLNVRGL